MNRAVEISLPVKVLSVNEAFQGRRFRTKKYDAYEKEVRVQLKPIPDFPPPPYRIDYEFGMSNVLCDWDNPIKCLTDIIAKHYQFNDRLIQEAHVKKVKVKKGAEYFTCKIETIAV